MRLSIIIPVYNEVATVEEAISRVNSVVLDLEKEIIIVDDGSSDGTKKIIEKLKGDSLKKLYLTKNQGKGAAIRAGLKEISGDIVIIQDADLEYHPEDYVHLIEPILKKRQMLFSVHVL